MDAPLSKSMKMTVGDEKVNNRFFFTIYTIPYITSAKGIDG